MSSTEVTPRRSGFIAPESGHQGIHAGEEFLQLFLTSVTYGIYSFQSQGTFLELLTVEKSYLHIKPKDAKSFWYPSFNSNFK